MLRKLWLSIILATVCAVGLAPGPERASAAEASPPLAGFMQNFQLADQPETVGDLVWRDADGAEVRLADFAGKVVLLNFWATWCAPCVREMPSLDRLQAARGSDDFTVIALSADFGGMNQILPFYEKTEIAELAPYHDPKGAVRRSLGVRGLPTTILFDRGGREIGRLEGVAEWDDADAKALMDWAVGRSSEG